MDSTAFASLIVLVLATAGLGFAGFGVYRAMSEKAGIVLIVIAATCGIMAMSIFFKFS